MLLAASLLGCKTIPAGHSAIDAVTVHGADKVEESDVKEKIATSSSPRFAMLFRGVVYEYSIFDRFVLQRDMARIESFYQTKGYYEAHARAARVHQLDSKHVQVEIDVEEGKPVLVHDYVFAGLDELPPDIVAGVRAQAQKALPRNKPFAEEPYDESKNAVLHALRDRGYAYARVDTEARVDLVRHTADVIYRVEAGKPCTFGTVEITGLGALPEARVRRTLDLRKGAPYSQAAIDAAEQAALDLGVFSSVAITPDLAAPDVTEVPIRVAVEVSRLRTVKLGAGVEIDALKSEVSGVAGWQNKNFLGGLRTFDVQFRPGVIFYPLRFSHWEVPKQLMPEERLRLEIRQPGLFEARTNGFLRPEFNIYPLLIDSNPPPDARVLGYAEGKAAVGADRTFGKFFYAALSHNVQVAYPFAYRGTREPSLSLMTISYPELLVQVDWRDDKLRPHKGVFASNTLQVAGFGGQARDVKVIPEARGYLPITKSLTWATRTSVGFLWPKGYGSAVQHPDSAASGDATVTRDYQLTFFRGLFSGGPTSNRGYPFRGVSPYANIPQYAPEGQTSRLNTSCKGNDCRAPSGGFTLWELSTEMRIDISGPLATAIFCDASDVSPSQTDIRLKHLHLSCGAGARYDTPVGAIRLDVGYRIPGMQVLGGLTSDEKEPDTFPLGIPIAVSIGIGEAY